MDKVVIWLIVLFIVPVMVSIMVSIVSEYQGNHNTLKGYKRKEWQAKILNGLFLSLCVNLILGGFYFLLTENFTRYNSLYFSLVLSFFILYIIKPVLHHKINCKQVMLFSAMTAVLSAVYAAMTAGQTVITSDVATSFLLAREQVKNLSLFPYNWCYANGEVWIFSQNLVAILITYLFKDQVFARALQSVIVVIMTLFSMKYASKKIFEKSSWMISVPLFLIFLYGSLHMILYEAAYAVSMFILCLCATWMIVLIEEENKKIRILLSVLICFLTMSGIREIAEIVLPLMGAIIVAFYLENKEKSFPDYKFQLRKVIVNLIFLMIPTAIGYICYLFIRSSHMMGDTVVNEMAFADSLAEVWNNIVLTLINVLYNFGFTPNESVFSFMGLRNLLSVMVGIMVVIVIPILQLKRIEQEKTTVKVFIYYGVIHNLILIVTAVFFGKTTDRYLLTCIYVCILISAHYIVKYWLMKKNLQTTAVTMIVVGSILFESAAVYVSCDGWQHRLEDCRYVTKVLNEHEANFGYATYWNAYSNVIYSDFKIQVSAVNVNESGISPFYWLTNSEWYEADYYHGNTFLMLSGEEKALAEGNGLLSQLGETLEQFEIEGTGLYVYVYDYNIMEVLNTVS